MPNGIDSKGDILIDENVLLKLPNEESQLTGKLSNKALQLTGKISNQSCAIMNSEVLLDINFNNNIDIDTFYTNIEIFINILTNLKIDNIDTLNKVLELNNKINTYITFNINTILNLSDKERMGIKITFIRINDLIEKKISFIGFLGINEINEILRPIKPNFKYTYYLFVPPDKELPKDISPIDIITQLKSDSDIYSNQTKFEITFDKLKVICTKLKFNQQNTLSNLTPIQLKEMIACLDLLLEQIESVIEKKGLSENKEEELLSFRKIYLSKAIIKVKESSSKIEFPKNISNYLKIFKNTSLENNKIENLRTNDNAFAEFKNTFTNFQEHLIINKNLLNEIEKERLNELKETLLILKNILLDVLKIDKNKLPPGKKIIYNASRMLGFIDGYNDKQLLANS